MTTRIEETVGNQKSFYRSGATRPLEFRLRQLGKLREMIEANESSILQVLATDLGKPATEAYTSEVGMLVEEIKYVEKRLKRWAKPHSYKTMLMNWPARSYSIPEPYGVVCIVGPWNYPFQLMLSPLIGAVAAGNCSILKPSELAAASSDLLEKLITETFDPGHIKVVRGDSETASKLVYQPFDYIFFTGSTVTGRKVLEAAAAGMTPCTLELGGKNPCIVDKNCNIRQAAVRIAWGKFFNAGQTCVAPDFVMAHSDIVKIFTRTLAETLIDFYGNSKKDYAHIINEYHYDRLLGLMDGCTILHGGSRDRENLSIEPTLIADPGRSHPLMNEEIFGPLLPIVPWGTVEELQSLLTQPEKPLAQYVFSHDKQFVDFVLHTTSAGTACVNGTLSQLASFTLPFGGVGKSGIGKYRGQHSFRTFSHEKSVLERNSRFAFNAVLPPYNTPLSLIKKTTRLLFKHL